MSTTTKQSSFATETIQFDESDAQLALVLIGVDASQHASAIRGGDFEHPKFGKCHWRPERNFIGVINSSGKGWRDPAHLVSKSLGITYPEAMKRLNKGAHVKSSTKRAISTPTPPLIEQSPATPLAKRYDLFGLADAKRVEDFCGLNPPITPAMLIHFAATYGNYRQSPHSKKSPSQGVIGIPAYDPATLEICNYEGFSLTNAEGIAHREKEAGQWVTARKKCLALEKNKIDGIMASPATLDVLRSQSPIENCIVLKVEGPKDLFCAQMLIESSGLSVIAFTNLFGARSLRAIEPMMARLKSIGPIMFLVCHDQDTAGREGANLWLKAAKAICSDVRNIELPYPMAPKKGKDLRDYIGESTRTWGEFLSLAIPIEQLTFEPAIEEDPILEMPDDPHRLARLNLRLYRAGGCDLKYWSAQWFRYKFGRYEQISEGYLQARVTQNIKAEFDRLWHQDNEEYKEKKNRPGYDEKGDKGAPTVRKVTVPLVKNVMAITKAECTLPSTIEMPCWLEDRSQPHLLAMGNGLLDLQKLEQDAIDEGKRQLAEIEAKQNGTWVEPVAQDDIEDDSYLRELSPLWFSTFSLDYNYVEDWDCLKWKGAIHTAMQGDWERIFILQEWTGYLLTATNDLQRFLCVEGEGGNGKTVFFAGIEAMLGSDNVSHVPVENFGGRFDLGSTLGKAANICGDVGEIDQVAEGTLKQFTGGDTMFFDRKGIAPISARPTAKLMCSWNNRPRFRDRSSGIWRRMLLVPFLHTISKTERITGMDTRNFWVNSGEVPGILNWAIEGLFRLRKNKRFTESKVCNEAQSEFRSDSNPAGEFLDDHIKKIDGSRILATNEIYAFYKLWCEKSGRYPLGDSQFFRELKKKFPHAERKRISTPGRPRGYTGIGFSEAEIFGERTPGTTLAIEQAESE